MALRFLPNPVPNYGEVPADRTGSEILRKLEGKPVVSSPQVPRGMYMGGKSGEVQAPQQLPEQESSPPPQQWQGPAPSPTHQAASGFAGSLIGQALGGAGTGVPATPIVYGGTPVAGAAAAPMTLGSMATAAAPYAAAPIAAATAYNTLTGLGNAVKGQDMSLAEEASLALPTFGASFLVDPVKDALGLGSGKDKDQLARDAQRRQMQTDGLIDQNYNFTLPDGSTHGIGGDGSEQTYNVANAEDPVTGRVVGVAQVLAGIYTGKPGSKEATDMTGWFTNMAMSNAGGNYEAAMDNLLSQFVKIAEQRKLTPQATRDMLKQWKEQGLIDEQTYAAYAAAHESLVDGNPWQFDNETAKAPAQAPAPSGEAPAAKIMMGQSKQPPPNAPVPQRIVPPTLKEVEDMNPLTRSPLSRSPRLNELTAYASRR